MSVEIYYWTYVQTYFRTDTMIVITASYNLVYCDFVSKR